MVEVEENQKNLRVVHLLDEEEEGVRAEAKTMREDEGGVLHIVLLHLKMGEEE